MYLYLYLKLCAHGMFYTLEKQLSEMKNGVFWDVTPCGSYKNRRFGGT
jgi:hypothetical protein